MLLSGGHSRRVLAQATSFIFAAALFASGTYGAFAALGSLVPWSSPALARGVVVAGAGLSLLWYLHPISHLVPSSGKQVNRRYAEVPIAGPLLFGAILGIGLLTAIRTPLIWLGVFATLFSGSFVLGGFYGLGFAFARSAQVIGSRRTYTPSVDNRIGPRLPRNTQRNDAAGIVIAASLLVLTAVVTFQA